MRRTIGTSAGASWIDVIDPSPEELDSLAKEFLIDVRALRDTLNPVHLPKFEVVEGVEFTLLRVFDENCIAEADTTQELTRKIAIFRKSDVLLTVHRKELPSIAPVVEKWTSVPIVASTLPAIVYDLFRQAQKSFDSPIRTALDQLEALEMSIFEAEGAKPFDLKEAYLLKRRSFVFKRLLRLMLEVIVRLKEPSALPKILHTGRLKEECERFLYYCDELLENANSLLNLQISLASQKSNESSRQTNEVMRVLTVFSVFLLPINVITGIYGMNFEWMPELKWQYGYAFALALMIGVVTAIYLWFRSKGWLKGRE